MEGENFVPLPNILLNKASHIDLHAPMPPYPPLKWISWRKHRHIVETGLTLLAQTKMPLKFWDHAFLTATYLINRLASPTSNNQSPFLLLIFQFPDYKFLKSFGCACFPFLRPYNSQKVYFHSKECIFLGYSPSHKGYKCLDSSGKIFISKDVVFNEVRFPYPELFPSSSNYNIVPDEPTLSSFLSTHLPISITSSSPTTNSTPQTTPYSSHNSISPPIINSPLSPDGQISATQNQQSPTLTLMSHTDSYQYYSPDHVFNPTPINILSPSPSPSNTPSSSSTNTPITPLPKPHRIYPLNTHYMPTRGKLGIVQPRPNPTLLFTHLEPTSHKQALLDHNWHLATQTE